MISSLTDERRNAAGGYSQRALTTTQIVHQRLRDEIISMQRLPGEPISEKEIALEIGVSRTPIREALLRLSEERLVDIVPKSGTSVAKIPIADVLESQVARAALEQVTTIAAVKRAKGSDIASMQALLVVQQEQKEAVNYEKFYKSDEDLHHAIALAGGYPGIWTIIDRIKIQVDRYRLLTLQHPLRMERVLEEHRNIVEAIAEHDEHRAAEAMRLHLDGLSAEDLRVIRDHNPSYFVGDLDQVLDRWGRDISSPN
ncbi:GntR family transcriptional regulator [uncultured Cohaesibacter sp.]|uniref:GntR family transcriptional regulator n=1 Tax=uncultured Cohaesibacter sp. TaxID=1002546 RepID=UPI0029C9A787|nr:GntR family transcriptional regulator [uncultured Cohaesibacter sp.]